MSRMLFLSASFAALAFAAPALGQDAPNTDEAITVTATGRAAPVSRLPADVTIIDADEALERGAPTLDAALSDAPGLQVVRAGPFGQQASIFSGGANSNHTLVLFDGVRVNDPSAPGAGFDAGQDLILGLDRIEVVRGPMSALYGSDAIGGVVNLIPRRGGEGALNARLDIAGASFGTLLAQAGMDGTLGALRYAVSAEGFATDGYDIVPKRIAGRTGDPDGAQMSAVTGAFDLALSQAFALDLLLRARDARADFDAFPFDLNTFQEFRADDPDLEIARNDMRLARLGATWRASEALSLRVAAGTVTTDRAQADGGVETDAFDGERRFAEATGQFSRGPLALRAGVTTETEEIEAIQFGAPIDAEQDHDGAFLSAHAELGLFELTGAVRLDEYEGFGEEVTWRLGAQINPLPNARLYASAGTSFRAPTLYERFVSFGNPALDPESGESWEIGGDIRFDRFGQPNGVELSALYRASDIADMIDFGPFFTYANIDAAEIESAQARIALRPTDWLTARAAYVYTDAKDATTDLPLLRRPEQAWTASLEAERGAFSGALSWRRIGARADILYGDDSFFIGVGEAEEYDVVRLTGAWALADGVRLYAAADNLLDEDYEAANAFAGAPRSLMIGVRLQP